RASAGSVLFPRPRISPAYLTRAGFTTLMGRLASAKARGGASLYGPGASRQEGHGPAAGRSGPGGQAAAPPGGLGEEGRPGRGPGARRQASRVSLLTSIPTKVVGWPTASSPQAHGCGVSAGAAPGRASEVEERRRSGRHLVPEVKASAVACGCSDRRARSDTVAW